MSTGEQTPTVRSFGEDVLERMVLAVENVRNRLRRASNALEEAKVPYAVIGGNAVAAWVSMIDPSVARNTVDVDLLVNRADFDTVKVALEKAGFVYRHDAKFDMFLDGPGGRARDAVHILFAGEKIYPEDYVPTPTLTFCPETRSFLTD